MTNPLPSSADGDQPDSDRSDDDRPDPFEGEPGDAVHGYHELSDYSPTTFGDFVREQAAGNRRIRGAIDTAHGDPSAWDDAVRRELGGPAPDDVGPTPAA